MNLYYCYDLIAKILFQYLCVEQEALTNIAFCNPFHTQLNNHILMKQRTNTKKYIKPILCKSNEAEKSLTTTILEREKIFDKMISFLTVYSQFYVFFFFFSTLFFCYLSLWYCRCSVLYVENCLNYFLNMTLVWWMSNDEHKIN